MTAIRQYAWVVFDRDTCPEDIYELYFKDKFEHENGSLKMFVFLGDSPQIKGHCFIADIETGLVSGLYHTSNFREAVDEEHTFSFEIPIDEEE